MAAFKQNWPAQSINNTDMNWKICSVNDAYASHGRNMAVMAGAARFRPSGGWLRKK
jgi:hypothetical protein